MRMNAYACVRSAVLALTSSLVLASCGGGGSGGAFSANPPAGGGPSAPTAALGSGPFLQVDRLNRPAINEVFATFAQHQQNNVNTPNQDVANLKPEIIAFTES